MLNNDRVYLNRNNCQRLNASIIKFFFNDDKLIWHLIWVLQVPK